MIKRTKRLSLPLAAALSLSFAPAGCLFWGHAKTAPAKQSANAAPDKILYDRALNDYKHGHYTESRLSLQTLINSYPDSEYLAKAKLAVADSYYKEGGTEGLTEAVAEYKDFITFFPFLEEAAYAQMQVGMAHYRMMQKPDRDPTQARMAEQEFQTFLLKYPRNQLAPQAAQRLREVQEVLSQADFDVAHFYYLKGDYRASASRLIEVTNRYPLFSQADRALWMLGDIYRRAARGSRNETERARWRTMSDEECARIVKEYPLSPYVAAARKQMDEDGAKIPPPDAEALARMKYEEKFTKERKGFLGRTLGVIRPAPDVSMAAHAGEPDLNPPGELESPQQAFASAPGETSATNPYLNPDAKTGATVQPVSPGESSSSASGAAVIVPTDPQSSSSSTSSSAKSPDTSGAANASKKPAKTGSAEISPNAPPPPPPTIQTATDAAAAQVTAPPPAASDKSAGKSADSADAASADANPNDKAAKKKDAKHPKAKLDKDKESTSKKKKGLRKLIPW